MRPSSHRDLNEKLRCCCIQAARKMLFDTQMSIRDDVGASGGAALLHRHCLQALLNARRGHSGLGVRPVGDVGGGGGGEGVLRAVTPPPLPTQPPGQRRRWVALCGRRQWQ